MKIKTRELIGPALDWAVAKCEGRTLRRNPMGPQGGHGWWVWEETPVEGGGIRLAESVYLLVGGVYSPSTDWLQGGPIIDREGISAAVRRVGDTRVRGPEGWYAYTPGPGTQWVGSHGHDPLVAAMRCYVASKLGDEVDVPAELQGA